MKPCEIYRAWFSIWNVAIFLLFSISQPPPPNEQNGIQVQVPMEGFCTLHSLLIIIWWCSDINNHCELVYCGHVPIHTVYSQYRALKHHPEHGTIISPLWMCPKPNLITNIRHTNTITSVSPSVNCGRVPNHTLYSLGRPHKHNHKYKLNILPTK